MGLGFRAMTSLLLSLEGLDILFVRDGCVAHNAQSVRGLQGRYKKRPSVKKPSLLNKRLLLKAISA